jgi:hypothetical protein
MDEHTFFDSDRLLLAAIFALFVLSVGNIAIAVESLTRL